MSLAGGNLSFSIPSLVSVSKPLFKCNAPYGYERQTFILLSRLLQVLFMNQLLLFHSLFSLSLLKGEEGKIVCVKHLYFYVGWQFVFIFMALCFPERIGVE